MEIFYETLAEEWDGLMRIIPRFVVALVVLGFSIILGRTLGKGIGRIISRGSFKTAHRNFFRGLTQWLIVFLGIILGLNILGLKSLATSLVAGGGITAVVLGFAFREIGENLLAGFFLAFSRPFEIGDLIQSSDFQGTVKSIELRSTHIRTADGRDIYIPSSEIFNKPLINKSLPAHCVCKKGITRCSPLILDLDSRLLHIPVRSEIETSIVLFSTLPIHYKDFA